MSDEERPPPDNRWPDWVEEWVIPYMEEPFLWPVLVAILGHIVILLAFLLVGAWREGISPPLAGIAALGVVSVGLVNAEVRYRRRPGAVAITVVLTWLVSAGVAAVGGHYGLI